MRPIYWTVANIIDRDKMMQTNNDFQQFYLMFQAMDCFGEKTTI